MMRLPKLALTVLLVCLIAAACSGDSEDSGLTPTTAEAVAEQPAQTPTSQPTETAQTPTPEQTGTEEGPSTAQQELADAIFTAMIEDDELPAAITEDQIHCLGDRVAGVFSDERIAEMGVNGAQLIEAYVDRGSFALGDDYGITDDEASEVVDRVLDCLDWRLVLAESIAAEGLPAEQASCFVSEISDEGLRATIESGFITETEDDFGLVEEEVLGAFQSCVDIRELLYQQFVQEGLSEQSARCVADGMPEGLVEMMLGGPELEDDEAALEFIGELMALQNRCLTPEEMESMGGFGG